MSLEVAGGDSRKRLQGFTKADVAFMGRTGRSTEAIVGFEYDECDVHPAQSKCRRQAAQLIEDSFQKSKFDIKVTLANSDDTSIVFTPRTTLSNKKRRAVFYSKFMGSDFENSLCKAGFRRLVLNGSDKSEEYDISCREALKPCVPENSTQLSNTLGRGHIRGTLTYYFNNNYGSGPDVGSQIWLIRGHIEVPSSASFLGLPDQIVIDKAHSCSVAHTIADGNGVFDLSELLSGDYTLIIQSNHTKGAPGFGAAAATMRDVGGRVVTFPVTLGPGQTIDRSWDFGISSFLKIPQQWQVMKRTINSRGTLKNPKTKMSSQSARAARTHINTA